MRELLYMMIFALWAFCAFAAAVIIYWPFVHKVGDGPWLKSLFLAAACQLASFITGLLLAPEWTLVPWFIKSWGSF